MLRHGWSDSGLGGQSNGERSYGGGGVSDGWYFFPERFWCAMTFM